jgi:ankyrin repeat protein
MPVLQCLLAVKSVDVQAPMGVGGLTLLHVACSNGHLPVARLLLEHKASARASDHKGVTPLHLAALHATKPLVTLLLAAKAVVGARDASQQTVLHYAARGGAAGVLLDVLLEAYTKDSGVLKGGKAKSASLVDPRDAWQRTPLHWAVINGHQAVVVRLLGAGADAKARDLKENSVEMAERRAKCGASDRQVLEGHFADAENILLSLL